MKSGPLPHEEAWASPILLWVRFREVLDLLRRRGKVLLYVCWCLSKESKPGRFGI